MDKRKTVVIGEDIWRRLKHRATDDSITLREVVERAAHLYLGSSGRIVFSPPSSSQTITLPGPSTSVETWPATDGSRELTYAHGDD